MKSGEPEEALCVCVSVCVRVNRRSSKSSGEPGLVLVSKEALLVLAGLLRFGLPQLLLRSQNQQPTWAAEFAGRVWACIFFTIGVLRRRSEQLAVRRVRFGLPALAPAFRRCAEGLRSQVMDGPINARSLSPVKPLLMIELMKLRRSHDRSRQLIGAVSGIVSWSSEWLRVQASGY